MSVQSEWDAQLKQSWEQLGAGIQGVFILIVVAALGYAAYYFLTKPKE